MRWPRRGGSTTRAGRGRRALRARLKVPATSETRAWCSAASFSSDSAGRADAEDLTQAREALRAVDPRRRSTPRARRAADRPRARRCSSRTSSARRPSCSSRRSTARPCWGRGPRPGAGLVGDRHRSPRADSRPRTREPFYRRIIDPHGRGARRRSRGSAPAGYWLAAAARGAGNLDRAWHAATRAGCARCSAAIAAPRCAADLDRLMVQAHHPGARPRSCSRADPSRRPAGMLAEWEAIENGLESGDGRPLSSSLPSSSRRSPHRPSAARAASPRASIFSRTIAAVRRPPPSALRTAARRGP